MLNSGYLRRCEASGFTTTLWESSVALRSQIRCLSKFFRHPFSPGFFLTSCCFWIVSFDVHFSCFLYSWHFFLVIQFFANPFWSTHVTLFTFHYFRVFFSDLPLFLCSQAPWFAMRFSTPCVGNKFQVQIHPACLWAARVGRRNLERIGEDFLQGARCSSLGLAGSKYDEIFRQVCPQFRVGCQSVPMTRLSIPGVRLKLWCPVMSRMSCNTCTRFPTRGSLDPPCSR